MKIGGNFLGAAASLASKLVASGAVVTEAQAVVSFIGTAVHAAEQTGLSGTDKMTKVLNATEVAVGNAGPGLAGDFGKIAADVEAVVNELVAVFHEVGLFVHKAEAAVQGVVSEVERTLHGG